METVDIPKRSVYRMTVPVNGPNRCMLIWKFSIARKCIGFSITRQRATDKVFTEVLPMSRTDGHEGSLIIDEPAVYLFVFNNSFSKITTKRLSFIVEVRKLPELMAGAGLLPGSPSASVAGQISAELEVPAEQSPLPGTGASAELAAAEAGASHSTATSVKTNSGTVAATSASSSPTPQQLPLRLQGTTQGAESEDIEVCGWVLKRKRQKGIHAWSKRWLTLRSGGLLSYHKTPSSNCRGIFALSCAYVSANAPSRQLIVDTGNSVLRIRVPESAEFLKWVRALSRYRAVRGADHPMLRDAVADVTPSAGEPAKPHLATADGAGLGAGAGVVIPGGVGAVAPGAPSKIDDVHFDLEVARVKLDVADDALSFASGLLLAHQAVLGPAAAAALSRVVADGHHHGGDSDSSDDDESEPSLSADLASPTMAIAGVGASASGPLAGSPEDALVRLLDALQALRSAYSLLSLSERSLAQHLPASGTSGVLLTGSGRLPSVAPVVATDPRFLADSDEDFFDAQEASDSDSSDDDMDLGAGESVDVVNRVVIPQAATAPAAAAATALTPAPAGLRPTGMTTSVPRLARKTLLVPSPAEVPDVGLFGLLRKSLGKDMSRISMPVVLNEPLNVMQNLCEDLEYAALLNQAASSDNPLRRLALVSAFAVSSYARTAVRFNRKPFNPLLGETFEFVQPAGPGPAGPGFRFFSEKVSHHPFIVATHCSSINYTMWQDLRPTQKFGGRSIEMSYGGTVFLDLHVAAGPGGAPVTERYSWERVTSTLRNALSANRSIEHHGTMVVASELATGRAVAEIEFVAASGGGFWGGGASASANKNEVTGQLSVPGCPAGTLSGRWDESLQFSAPQLANGEVIWRATPPPANHLQQFGFSEFAVGLNDPNQCPELLPRTDTRFRTDQRMLEECQFEEAEVEKDRLENRQRAAREQAMAELGTTSPPTWNPRWFQTDEAGRFAFTGEYWTVRDGAGGFSGEDLPDLYSDGPVSYRT
ncbi:hypothetical protein H696_04212 [Fonticula alba]|uniref:PH domain-containing protein n=1 Tax=Fonticula alba TaxID=691883 RepID=A0A058Z4E0_FONAL|nr:hypothetical protein H696_04212 [Fonticula alba]KCV68793.1 hypothetical protein H696_04212 [Fonticula alba]|eukprot:XP_009496364.1 hypothetical protein H696_04212 [Fonticula alba]